MAAESIRMTRDAFLWCMSVVYLFAFTSLFVQIPGLYGDNGILPAKLVLDEEADSFHDLVVRQPTLLRLLPRIGFDVQTGLDFLCLGGAVLAFVAMISRDQRNCVVFAALWAFYLSVFQVGQTFLWFKWDVLLLEVGFLAMIVAPLSFFGLYDFVWYHVYDRITFWLIRWLLFRVTFANGVAKLTGDDQESWWSLTAVSQHYESQYIPTTLAWYFHQFPEWLQKLGAVGILTGQLAISLLILSPIRNQRLLAFYSQVFIILLMTLTGNHGFSTLLTLTLSLSLVDDDWLDSWVPQFIKGKSFTRKDHIYELGQRVKPLKTVFTVVSYGALIFGVVRYFNLQILSQPARIESAINFDAHDFEIFVRLAVLITALVGVCSFAWQIFSTSYGTYRYKSLTTKQRTTELTGSVALTLLATFLFASSLVPHAALNKDTEQILPSALRDVQSWSSKQYQLTNSYLFDGRSSDEDIDGRSEVVLEGSYGLESGWKEYNFHFKPGNVTNRLPVVSPHQPRLDFQMWFAARRNYKQNHWLLHLVYRLLTQQAEVLDLMGENPFPSHPPKYIRASLYAYKFTSADEVNDRHSDDSWWVRERVGDYLPIVSLDEPTFVDYIRHAGLHVTESDAVEDERRPSTAENSIAFIRSLLGRGNGSCICICLVVAGILLTLLDPAIEIFRPEVKELPDTRMHLDNGLK